MARKELKEIGVNVRFRKSETKRIDRLAEIMRVKSRSHIIRIGTLELLDKMKIK